MAKAGIELAPEQVDLLLDSVLSGDLVRLVPNHSCVVSNLVDAAWLVDGHHVATPLPIAARGCLT